MHSTSNLTEQLNQINATANAIMIFLKITTKDQDKTKQAHICCHPCIY